VYACSKGYEAVVKELLALGEMSRDMLAKVSVGIYLQVYACCNVMDVMVGGWVCFVC
jgi:hypothetical protein